MLILSQLPINMGEGSGDNGDAKLYTLTDLKAHTTEKTCFLLVHGKVYDVTDFLDEHPGGQYTHNTKFRREIYERLGSLHGLWVSKAYGGG